MYQFCLILHLFCAIFFIGYVFADCFLCEKSEQFAAFRKKHLKFSGVFFGLCFVLLLASGGVLLKFSDFGVFNWVFFALKMATLLALFGLAGASIILLKIFKINKHFLITRAHEIAVFCCFLIVLFAKIMQWG